MLSTVRKCVCQNFRNCSRMNFLCSVFISEGFQIQSKERGHDFLYAFLYNKTITLWLKFFFERVPWWELNPTWRRRKEINPLTKGIDSREFDCRKKILRWTKIWNKVNLNTGMGERLDEQCGELNLGFQLLI